MTWAVRWALCASLICAVPAEAQVKTDHLLGKYSTTDDGCRDEATQDFEIRRGIVEGPDIFCILGATRPTDKGTEAYEARCTEKGDVRLGTMRGRARLTTCSSRCGLVCICVGITTGSSTRVAKA